MHGGPKSKINRHNQLACSLAASLAYSAVKEGTHESSWSRDAVYACTYEATIACMHCSMPHGHACVCTLTCANCRRLTRQRNPVASTLRKEHRQRRFKATAGVMEPVYCIPGFSRRMRCMHAPSTKLHVVQGVSLRLTATPRTITVLARQPAILHHVPTQRPTIMLPPTAIVVTGGGAQSRA